jgi:FMN-dependent NADH-azoreductase
MSRVLYIQALPRFERSYSIAVANVFIASYRIARPGDEIHHHEPVSERFASF